MFMSMCTCSAIAFRQKVQDTKYCYDKGIVW